MAACTNFRVQPFPEPIRPPLPVAGQEGEEVAAQEQTETAGRYTPVPGVHISRTQARGAADELGADLEGPPIEAAFNGVPIVAFINEVFGTQLGMSFVISPSLQEKQDLVTLRLTDAVPPRQFFDTARQVLQEYGVTIRERDEVLTFVATQEITTGEIPLLISGRTLPEVPATHRIVFQLAPLMVARPNQVISMLREAFPQSDLEVREQIEQNAVLLKGTPERVSQALELIEVLDQPLLRGRHGLIVEPEYLAPEDLFQSVKRILEAEGYNVSSSIGGSIVLLPFNQLGKLVMFAQNQALLDHAIEWIERLDVAYQQEIEEGLFIYEVKHTQIADLVETLGKLTGDGASAGLDGGDALGQPGGAGAASASGTRRDSLVVDEKRNLLIFRGSGEEWAEMRKVLDQLDRPVPSVLIEVMIAEITLTDEEGSGFDFVFKGGTAGIDSDYGFVGRTRGKLGVSDKGFSLSLNNAGEVRAMLNLYYEDNRASIRSQPRVLVKSGEEANIEVGNEIPVITQVSQGTVEVGGSTNVLQQVSYRKTGVNLSITPFVQASGLVDVTIRQELSEARLSAATSQQGSPTILNRTLSTSLTLQDGGSLLMGGLISENTSLGEQGVPGLSRVPLLGRLFRRETYQGDRTELLVMVTPYVVRNRSEGTQLTEEIKSELELHKEFMAE